VNESESVSYWSQTLALPGGFLVQGSVKIQIWVGARGQMVTEKYTRRVFGSGKSSEYEGRSGDRIGSVRGE